MSLTEDRLDEINRTLKFDILSQIQSLQIPLKEQGVKIQVVLDLIGFMLIIHIVHHW